MNIAVFLDQQGFTAPLGQSGVVTLYTRDGAGWRISQRVPFTLSRQMGLGEIRNRTMSMLAALPDCRHFVARDIQGALLAWLDGMGMTLWQCEGRPEAFLDRLAEHISERITAAEPVVTPLPASLIQPTGDDGAFRLDLIAALRDGGGSGHTSKRLLLPFLQQRHFQRLEILCDHLPRWFDTLLPDMRLSASVTPRPDGTLCVVVTPV